MHCPTMWWKLHDYVPQGLPWDMCSKHADQERIARYKLWAPFCTVTVAVYVHDPALRVEMNLYPANSEVAIVERTFDCRTFELCGRINDGIDELCAQASTALRADIEKYKAAVERWRGL